MEPQTRSIRTCFPNLDFAPEGHWFWLKSVTGNGFDGKAFNREHIYMRATELTWTNKRFHQDLPLHRAASSRADRTRRFVSKIPASEYFDQCKPYKASDLSTAVNDLDAPQLIDAGENVGQVGTRVLHYRYNCENFKNCVDEEQFFLANGYGLWQWKHYHHGVLVKATLMNRLETGLRARKSAMQR